MKRKPILLFLCCFIILSSSSIFAEYPVINAEQLHSYLTGKKKVVLVDSRTSEEYQQAHIPGAINIMPEQMKDKAARLLKDKAALIIFYCRGMD